MELKVVEMLSDITSSGAHWVTGSAVRTQDGRVAVKAVKVSTSTGPDRLVGTIKDVVWLVSSVLDITPQKGSLECLTSLRGRVKAGGHSIDIASIFSSSTEQRTSDHGTLRVAVQHNQGVWALGIVLGDLPDAVGSTLLDGRAEGNAEGGVKDDIHVVAGNALGLELSAGSIDKGRGSSIVVRCVVSAGHEDGNIITGGGGLGGSSALCVSERNRGKDSSSEALLDGGCGRHNDEFVIRFLFGTAELY